MTAPDYVAQAADVIREFIVEEVGFDHGELMTVQSENLARNLAAAGLIPTSTEWGARGYYDHAAIDKEGAVASARQPGWTLLTRPSFDWKDASDD
ncbi:hypothetical protein [Oerskovia paurometabola]|uniref:hypothetical protein n=1 Tax=Oerskovia paurometabola TaxID=162170 RepID=UPI0034194D6D